MRAQNLVEFAGLPDADLTAQNGIVIYQKIGIGRVAVADHDAPGEKIVIGQGRSGAYEGGDN